jgi:acetyl-CoA carboxylase biotin carboxylase subunit
MFRRILVANRGEVAARICRTACRLGIQTVVLASEADAGAAWLLDAALVSEVAFLSGVKPKDTYLNQDRILELARHHQCSALHPGWGFLAENALFATRCASYGIRFIGPPPAAMHRLGNKVASRKTMKAGGVPVLPGSEGVVSLEEARAVANNAGYPVLLKARSGGGGRGMRRVYAEAELESAFAQATAESEAAFGDSGLFVEKYVPAGRHIEFQVMADSYGNVAVLGERECSVQRRHQKLVEESPSVAVSDSLRQQLSEAIIQAVRAAGYTNAGTVEMLMDPEKNLYFLEMNNRLQVEHPVTEAITGLDLVELQLRVACNEKLPEAVLQAPRKGHAIECRINAEDPDQDFKPAPGRVSRLVLPDGVRVETHLREGDLIPPHYDSMVAKLIAWGESRTEAIEKMKRALSSMVVEGVPTTLTLHQKILNDPRFISGNYDTRLLETGLQEF